MNLEDIISKYEPDLIKNLNKDNMLKIIKFLIIEKCDFIEEIIENYLDLFVFNYHEFINKYHQLNNKYNHQFLELASLDMNKLEEFYK